LITHAVALIDTQEYWNKSNKVCEDMLTYAKNFTDKLKKNDQKNSDILSIRKEVVFFRLELISNNLSDNELKTKLDKETNNIINNESTEEKIADLERILTLYEIQIEIRKKYSNSLSNLSNSPTENKLYKNFENDTTPKEKIENALIILIEKTPEDTKNKKLKLKLNAWQNLIEKTEQLSNVNDNMRDETKSCNIM
jgi:hypothetical protein